MSDASTRGRIRGLNRFRWLQKLRIVKAAGASLKSKGVITHLLWSPEVHTEGYSLVTDGQWSHQMSSFLNVTETNIQEIVKELKTDTALMHSISEVTKFHWESPRYPKIGRYITPYVMIRILQPKQIVELGCHFGLGSVVMLRALERNSEDGFLGELISIDLNPSNAWLPKRLNYSNWNFINGFSTQVLAKTEFPPKTDFLVLDTAPDANLTRNELKKIQMASAFPLAVVHNGDWNEEVRVAAALTSSDFVELNERSAEAWVQNRKVHLALLKSPWNGGLAN